MKTLKITLLTIITLVTSQAFGMMRALRTLQPRVLLKQSTALFTPRVPTGNMHQRWFSVSTQSQKSETPKTITIPQELLYAIIDENIKLKHQLLDTLTHYTSAGREKNNLLQRILDSYLEIARTKKERK